MSNQAVCVPSVGLLGDPQGDACWGFQGKAQGPRWRQEGERSQQLVKPGTQSLAAWPGTWNTALGVTCPLAGSVRLLDFRT